MTDDVLTGDDADEHAVVVRHRDEVLVERAFEQHVHADVDPNRRVEIWAENVTDMMLFLCLDGVVALVEDEIEEVALADGADIRAVVRDHRDRGVAVSAHFFDPLAQGVGFVEILNGILGFEQH